MDLIKGLVNLNLILFLCAFSFKYDTMWMQSVSLLTNSADNMTAHTGLTHVEAAVHCIVEIINAFTLVDSSDSTVSQAVRLYLNLLLCPDMVVSFSAKQAFIRVLRPRLKRRCVFIPIPPHFSTPPHLGTLR